MPPQWRAPVLHGRNPIYSCLLLFVICISIVHSMNNNYLLTSVYMRITQYLSTHFLPLLIKLFTEFFCVRHSYLDMRGPVWERWFNLSRLNRNSNKLCGYYHLFRFGLIKAIAISTSDRVTSSLFN